MLREPVAARMFGRGGREGWGACLPSPRLEDLEDMVWPELVVRLSLSIMSVITVLALWAAARRGRDAMMGVVAVAVV